jgi:hypothetical protein
MMKGQGLSGRFEDARSAASRLQRHWVFVVLVVCGGALRAGVTLAYRPALFYSDSADYLLHAYRLPLSSWHPPGYSVFLRIVLSTGTLAAVPITQHLMVLGSSVLLYATLIRLGVRAQLAGLACAPLLVDAYQLQIEQYVLSEALFEALVICIIATLLWSPYLTNRRLVLTGILLGAAAVVRLDAIGLMLPVAGFVVARWMGWMRTAALLMISALPLLGMASLRAAEGEGFSVTGGMGGIWLYGRVAPFANCSVAQIPHSEQRFCPAQQLGKRPGTSWFENSPDSPARLVHAGHAASSGELSDFARRIIIAQPLDYVRAVTGSFASQFRPTRSQAAGGPSVAPWIFATSASARDRFSPNPELMVALYGGQRPKLNLTLARLLHGYQRRVYTPGPLMAMCLLIALAGIYRPVRASQRQMAVALLTGLGVIVVLWATATVEFTWRYVLPSLALLPSAAALSAGSGIISRVALQRDTMLRALVFHRTDHAGGPVADPGTPRNPCGPVSDRRLLSAQSVGEKSDAHCRPRDVGRVQPKVLGPGLARDLADAELLSSEMSASQEAARR